MQRTKHDTTLYTGLVLVAFGSLTGCEAGPTNAAGERDPARGAQSFIDETDEPSDDIDDERSDAWRTPHFEVLGNLEESLMRRVLPVTAPFRVCLKGTGVTTSTRTMYQKSVEQAIRTWLGVIEGASKADFDPAKRSIQFVSCAAGSSSASVDVTVDWSKETETHTNCSPGTPGCHRSWVDPYKAVYLHAGNPQGVVDHEFGHLFGLGDTYNPATGISGDCKPGQPASLLCDSYAGKISDDDRAGAQEIFCSLFPKDCKLRWAGDSRWCVGADRRLFVGDFNGDARGDLLCHDTNTGTQTIVYALGTGGFTPTPWTGKDAGWCAGANSTLLVGNLNPDGRADLICHDRDTGALRTKLASTAGAFEAETWVGELGWCRAENAVLHAGDFSGDGRTDLFCSYDAASGSKRSVLHAQADGSFDGEPWTSELEWCGAGSIFVGDFDGNARADLLCHRGDGLADTFASANAAGTFAFDEEAVDPACGRDSDLLVGNFDGKTGSDLSCRTQPGIPYGTWKLHFAQPAGRFPGPSQQRPLNFCAEPAQLKVGDFDADGKSDFLCHDRAAGTLQVAYQGPLP